MRQQHVNSVILGAIPMDKGLKRFYLSQFQRMVHNNGPMFACDRFKTLRTALMGYRADKDRHNHLQQWLRTSGFHLNGWLRKLFSYMDTQPEFALQFVKLYCGPNQPIPTVDEAAIAQHKELRETTSVDPEIPYFLEEWVKLIAKPIPPRSVYSLLGLRRYYGSRYLDECVRNTSYEEFKVYVKTWKWIFKIQTPDHPKGSGITCQGQYFPGWHDLEAVPEMYTDFQGSTQESQGLCRDLFNLLSMDEYGAEDAGISYASLSFVLSMLDDVMGFIPSDEESLLSLKPPDADLMSGLYVGDIRHIPKKGTVVRRSIAAPNRFFQMAMADCNMVLGEVLAKLGKAGHDCTFNQTRFNTKIVRRLSRGEYVGSVDLHHATDYLPLSWMVYIWDMLLAKQCSEDQIRSWDLFIELSHGKWLNEGYLDEWLVGQPLGLLPSFKCLGITHNCFVESIALGLGLTYSPYCILGDDILVFNKDVRSTYIGMMQRHHVPLSLGKSFEYNLVEFAGQVFVKNLKPFYNTDQRALTWQSLFDYQWATGVFIPFGQLPRDLQKKFYRKVGKILQCSERNLIQAVYSLSVYYYMPVRGAHMMDLSIMAPLTVEDIGAVYQELTRLLCTEEEIPPVTDEQSGVVRLNDGFVAYLRYGCDYTTDFKPRYVRLKVQNWFRSKYRPVATDSLVEKCSNALSTLLLASAVTKDNIGTGQ